MAPRKRPCAICRRWFEPHPRAGDRQRVCSDEACQVERHRRSDKAWRAKNPDYDKKRRLKKKLEPAEPPAEVDAADDAADDPLDHVDWDAVERAIGPAHRVTTEETSRLLVKWAQDAVRSNAEVKRQNPDRLPRRSAQDAVAPRIGQEPPHADRLRPSDRKTQSDRGPPNP